MPRKAKPLRGPIVKGHLYAMAIVPADQSLILMVNLGDQLSVKQLTALNILSLDAVEIKVQLPPGLAGAGAADAPEAAAEPVQALGEAVDAPEPPAAPLVDEPREPDPEAAAPEIVEPEPPSQAESAPEPVKADEPADDEDWGSALALETPAEATDAGLTATVGEMRDIDATAMAAASGLDLSVAQEEDDEAPPAAAGGGGDAEGEGDDEGGW